ncbi:MAG: hypothetical protein AVO39_07215 [delta proteobacterium MLS_D]|jgi:D-glycero-beta-D-manno-heptose-7-phosphate kinase|nr:MAG: hypothetical protein AVO39_07215 [delta proteobacterium MLS_D]
MKKILSRKRAVEIIDRFPSARVFVVGDIIVDQFIWGKVSRISPEAPVPVVRVTSESLLLGGAANVLNNIYSLGGAAFIAGVTGRDEMGGWLRKCLEEMKVDAGGIIVKENRPTSVKTRVIAHNQQVVRFDRENRDPLLQKDRRKIIRYLQSLRDDIGVIVVSDYNKGIVNAELLEEITAVAKQSGIPIFVDPKQNGFSLYRGCDLITPNLTEASLALGEEMQSHDELVQGGLRLTGDYGFASLLITRGEEGMTLFEENGNITDIPAVAKEVYDVTGAGDTVIGIFALAVAAGASSQEAAVLANRAAGVAVGKVGTATVKPEELLSVL